MRKRKWIMYWLVIFVIVAGLFLVYTQRKMIASEGKVSLISSLQSHQEWVSSVSFASNRPLLASASFDKTIKLWRLEKGIQLLRTLEGLSEVLSVSFSPDSEIVASGNQDGTITLWRTSDGYLLKTFIGHQGGVNEVAFSPSGQFLASGGSDGTIKLWQVKGGKPVSSLTHLGNVWSISFSPDGRYLAFCYIQGSPYSGVGIWRIEEGKLVWIHKEEDKRKFINCVIFSPNGEYVASGSFDGTVKLWRIKDGKLMQTFEAKKSVESIAFTPNSVFLAAASVLAVTIWRVQDGSIVWQWLVPTPQSCRPSALTISHDGSLLAVGFSDGSIRVWQIQELK